MRKITLGKYGVVTLIDDEDYSILISYNWHLHRGKGTNYARTRLYKGGPQFYMHRIIMNPPLGLTVDHKDGNGLNNQRSNLRLATIAEQNRNLYGKESNTGYRGVSLIAKTGLYYASIRYEGTTYNLGSYKDVKLAASAYNEAAKTYHKDFAILNELN